MEAAASVSAQVNPVDELIAAFRGGQLTSGQFIKAIKAVSPQLNRVITVRMTTALHERLKAEADGLQVSLNQLCVEKLSK